MTQISTQNITKNLTLNQHKFDNDDDEIKLRIIDTNMYLGFLDDISKGGDDFDHDKWKKIQKFASFCGPAGTAIEIFMLYMPEEKSAAEKAIE